MNLLPLVFAILLILACTFSLSFQKTLLSKPVASTYQAHLKATRSILSSYESLCYKRLRSKKKPASTQPRSKNKKPPKQAPAQFHECSKINLWPLLQEGPEKHPLLYQLTLTTFHRFYGSILEEGRGLETQLLNAILSSGRQAIDDAPDATRIALEKLPLAETHVKRLYPLQTYFYRMLKGVKQTAHPMPSLLDLFCLEQQESKLCLKHATAEQLALLFGEKAAPKILTEIREGHPDQQRIMDLCATSGERLADEALFELIDLRFSKHDSHETTLVKEEEGVCLKKRVFLPG